MKSKEVVFGPVKAQIQADTIVLQKENAGLVLRAGDVEKLLNALGAVNGMRGLERLPASLNVPPFKVAFFEDDALTIRWEDDRNGELRLKFEEVDDVQQGVAEALKVALDVKRHAPPSRGGSLVQNEGTVWEQ